MLITMPDEFHTQAEDVTLRFRTTRPLGLLLTTNTEQSADRLELALMGGRVRLVARLGDKEKVGGCPHVNILAIAGHRLWRPWFRGEWPGVDYRG